MTNRYCPKCASEVEDTGGYCLLGHRLSLVAPTASLRELRAEVDRAFEDARVAVASTLGSPSEAPGQVPATPPPPPPQAARPHPPATPPAAPPVVPSVWHELSGERAHAGPDPIVAFAPAARMDWGPDRKNPLKRLRTRPERRDAAVQN